MSFPVCNQKKSDWSRPAWDFFHSIAFQFTPEKKQNYIAFLHSFGSVLPCPECKTHFEELLVNEKDNLKNIQTRDDYIRWSIDVHNQVNKRLGKRIVSYKEAFETHCMRKNKPQGGRLPVRGDSVSSESVSNETSSNHTMIYFILLVLCIFLVYMIRNKNNK